MEHAQEIALLEELQGLKEQGLFFLDDDIVQENVATYGPQRFAVEKKLFQKLPRPVALSSELSNPGDYLARDMGNLPLLLTRDDTGQVNAFLNVCRHRGARLTPDGTGCATRFTCPYHAWTYSNSGELRAVPHQKTGFPDLEKTAHGLTRLPVRERAGMIWAAGDAKADMEAAAPLDADFAWMGLPEMAIVSSEDITLKANWKLLIEGGLEAYHFKVAHKKTIGPHFLDNLSSYARIGRHLRSVLPRTSLPQLEGTPRESWRLRDHANVLYTCLPIGQFLVMQDHVAWIDAEPLAHDQTRLRLRLLAPKDTGSAEHWARNHAITKTTLMEDFELNEAQQAGLMSGAQTHLTFGRYEGALAAFNAGVNKLLQSID
ncbi:MAG: aromatic ring-hydroxylating dioxygenase subunit alpha [Pseudomonadota bacterium]